MSLLAEYALFLAKTLTVLFSILLILGKIFASKSKSSNKARVTIKKINEQFSDLKQHMQSKALSKSELKKWQKNEKKVSGGQQKSQKRSRTFYLRFKGDMQASQVESLRREITAVLLIANKSDEVVVSLESPGGVVHGYGLAASQLARLRNANIPLTVIVDKVAASGGYMMASVANTILAAPFAIIGSIGVLAQIPNFHRFLKKRDIDFEQITAGQYKRTLTYFGNNTTEDREKMQADIDETHSLFKEHIKHFRDSMDIDKVATGEYWYGTQAHELNLIDGIDTSDDYLLKQQSERDVFLISAETPKSFLQKLMMSTHQAWSSLFSSTLAAKDERVLK